jgi:transcriptional regulator with XRE-family HTH domain
MTITIANRLVELRKQSGLSQEELADKLGLSRQAVSKWERAEASPDTDNLICLAKIYNISLDELLKTDQSVEDIAKNEKEQNAAKAAAPETTQPAADKPEQAKPEQAKPEQAKPEETKANQTDSASAKTETASDGSSAKHTSEFHMDSSGIHFTDGEDSGSIDSHGIHITSTDGSGVHVEPGSVKITPFTSANDQKRNHRYHLIQDVVSGIVSMLCVIAYVLLGVFIKDPVQGWGTCWLVFFLIPLVSSAIEALRKKKFCDFCFPVLVAGLYVLFGMLYGAWHPEWVMFFAIPIYYTIFSAVDKAIHHGIDTDIDDDDDKDTDND